MEFFNEFRTQCASSDRQIPLVYRFQRHLTLMHPAYTCFRSLIKSQNKHLKKCCQQLIYSKMTNEADLEEQCEDAVFQICCTRERYSVRCANQMEKQLALITKMQTAEVKKRAVPNFEIPLITTEQEKLFCTLEEKKDKVKHSNSKTDTRTVCSRLKELKSIVNQIERSKNCEVDQLLKE